MSAKLICVTGMDGSGKSTVIAKVVEQLRMRGSKRAVPVAVWDALRARRSRRRVPLPRRDFEPYLAQLRPTSRALVLFHCLYEALQLAAAKGAELYLLDGYWYKYCAMEVAYGGDLAELVRLATIFPHPERLFYLRVDPSVAAGRKATIAGHETGFAAARKRDAFIAFQRKADVVLRQLVRRRGGIELDGHAPADAIAARIVTDVMGDIVGDAVGGAYEYPLSASPRAELKHRQ